MIVTAWIVWALVIISLALMPWSVLQDTQPREPKKTWVIVVGRAGDLALSLFLLALLWANLHGHLLWK